MTRHCWMISGLLVVLLGGLCAADIVSQEGTDWRSLDALRPPAPNRLAVAVLPFTTPKALMQGATQAQMERAVEYPRAATLLNLQRHGFRVVPEAASPSLVPALTDKAMGLKITDKIAGEWGAPEVIEVGRKVGADWMIYGSFDIAGDVRPAGFSVKKLWRVHIRLLLVDVPSGQVLYRTRVEAEAQGSSIHRGFGMTDEDSQIARSLFVQAVDSIFDDIARALPKHATGAEVKREDVERVIGAMGL